LHPEATVAATINPEAKEVMVFRIVSSRVCDPVSAKRSVHQDNLMAMNTD
jgi:hypothetical protein